MPNAILQANAQNQNNKKPGFWVIVFAVLAAAVGVQNKKNLERDFNQSSPIPFIVAGLIFTILFVVSLITIVSFVIV